MFERKNDATVYIPEFSDMLEGVEVGITKHSFWCSSAKVPHTAYHYIQKKALTRMLELEMNYFDSDFCNQKFTGMPRFFLHATQDNK